MFRVLSLFFGTIWLRPYVFVFLGAYLCLATWHLGAWRTLVFLILGYLIAWSMELSSIHLGFPFGEYYYIPATRDQELWVAGVPFMDSLSYVFLAYASYTMALLALESGNRHGPGIVGLRDQRPRFSWPPVILGAVLMMTLDVVIDPLALQGHRWFLGQIYGYPQPGVYFGVPLANFAGWLLVAFILIALLHWLATGLPDNSRRDWGRRQLPGQALLGPGLYLGILSFNLFMTFWIGEHCLGWVGVFTYLPFLTWLALKVSSSRL